MQDHRQLAASAAVRVATLARICGVMAILDLGALMWAEL
jgi:hypothetical protein